MGIELSNIRTFVRWEDTNKISRASADFRKDILDGVHGSRIVILHVRGNGIRNKGGTIERSEVLLGSLTNL